MALLRTLPSDVFVTQEHRAISICTNFSNVAGLPLRDEQELEAAAHWMQGVVDGLSSLPRQAGQLTLGGYLALALMASETNAMRLETHGLKFDFYLDAEPADIARENHHKGGHGGTVRVALMSSDLDFMLSQNNGESW